MCWKTLYRIIAVMICLLVVHHDPPLHFLGGIVADGTNNDAQQWMFVGAIRPCDESRRSSSSIDWTDEFMGRAGQRWCFNVGCR